MAVSKTQQANILDKIVQQQLMEWEDQNCQIVYKSEIIDQQKYDLEEQQRMIQNHEIDNAKLQQEIEELNNQIK